MKEQARVVKVIRRSPPGFFFLLAYLGAAIYFVSISNGSFWGVLLALLQAAIWPLYVVYHVLLLLHA
jgi:hypothetical protein